MVEMITCRDIFELPMNKNEAACITTNGIVMANGHAVMGAGIAKQANDLFHISYNLGSKINEYGNMSFNMGFVEYYSHRYRLFTFPTKHHWKDKSNIALIIKSANELKQLCDMYNIAKCYVPMVGCGCGNLSWDNVKPILSNILDDRFIVVVRREYKNK